VNNSFNIGIIGERINPGFKSTRALFDKQDLAGIQALALKQAEAGALYQNVNIGAQALIFFLIATWVGDSGAYYVGKNLGRHRMAPRISPNKTWEGLVAGIVTTFGAAAVMKLLFLELPWVHTMALAAILAVAGPLGDLVESQLKRDTGVKDSSGLIPGHGGLLDRTDSLFFAAAPALGYLVLVGLV